ncbi:hypothetical protein OESDEN_23805 [Oesophagostomum dentatum]|uniref:Uncharacterized protein n=1 Tax=Oesophagostomum dentatum TaxID=61180 RepID=A0A0B1S044_OESDE|nr:hypothetical protein OESDEN_23805 [Oesophagostomum dentatum]
MKILGSKQIMNVILFDVEDEESQTTENYTTVCNRILQAIDKNLPGAEETESSSGSDYSDEELDEEFKHDKKTL